MSETASLLAPHLLPARCAVSKDGEYRAWVRCRCGWESEDMPEMGSTPVYAATHAAHLAAIIDAHFAERERALVERVTKVAVEMHARAKAFSNTGIGDAYANATSFICGALDIDNPPALARPATEGEHG